MACLFLMQDTLDCAIYVDTGKTYPETQAIVEFVSCLLPVVIVYTDREAQNKREGIPADIVPVNWTKLGQSLTGPKPVMIQDYMICCHENISLPLFKKAQELRVDELVFGQREDEATRSTARNGDVVEGIKRLHPIEDWTRKQVLEYLETKMQVPPHFYFIEHSSLDCYDCTAYAAKTRDLVAFTKNRYPEFHKEYLERADAVKGALREELWEIGS